MFELNQRDFALAAAIGVIGFLFSTREWLLTLNGLDQLTGFIIYYAVMYGFLFALHKLDVILFKANVSDLQGTLGLMLILFAIAVTINWTNPYVQLVTTGNLTGASGVFYQAEDALSWSFATNVLGIQDVQTARIVAFSLVPFAVALLGTALIKGRVKFGLSSA